MMDEVGAVLSALSDPTRRQIVARLADGRATTATQLARDLPVSRQAVTKHLATLRDAHLVEPRRHGRESRYHLRPDGLRSASAWLADVEESWRTRLARLATMAEGVDRDDPGPASP